MRTCIICNAFSRSTSNLCKQCKERCENEKVKTCSLCREEKPWEFFHSSDTGLLGYKSQCKDCQNGNKAVRKATTLAGCLASLFNRSRISHRTRCRNNRFWMEDYTLTIEQLTAKWHAQSGRCALSGVKMTFGPFTDFAVSIERINNKITYTDENTILIISELNTAKQNTPQLLQKLLTSDTEPHPQLDLILQGPITRMKLSKRRHPSSFSTTTDSSLKWCNSCASFKDASRFSQRTYICKDCDAERRALYNTTIGGKLCSLLRGAKSRLKTRNGNGKRAVEKYEITIEMLWSLLQKQQGKCYYSGKNLSFKSGDNFHISLERKDPLKGYNEDNICLICQELQSSDRTVMSKSPITGGCGWSLEKFEKFRTIALEHNPSFLIAVSE